MHERLASRRGPPAVGALCSLVLAALLWLGSGQGAEAKRLAVVMGNAAYPGMPLANPENDATDMAARLQSLGFEVILRTNATRKQMATAISEFLRRVELGDDTIVFFAGHGVQVRGNNYMMPVDIDPQSDTDVEYEAIDLNKVMRGLNASGSRSNLLLLDACRNNPFERSWRSAGRGLAKVEAASGTLISYAAAPGTTAADGNGRNSPYTSAWLKALQVPNLPVEEILKRVHMAVRTETAAVQVTWQEGQIVGELVLNQEAAPLPAPAAAGARAGEPDAVELTFWTSAERNNLKENYLAYLERYPEGTFAVLARNQIALLETQAAAASTPRAAGADGGGAAEKPGSLEQSLWQSIGGSEDAGKLALFLEVFPNSPHAAEARTRLATATAKHPPDGPPKTAPRSGEAAMATAGRPATEQEMIAAAQSSADPERYRAYLAAYPRGAFVELARAELAFLLGRSKTASAGPAPATGSAATPTFDSPLHFGPSGAAGSSLRQLTQASPEYPPIPGLAPSLWQGALCSSCHNWTQANLCEQGRFYVRKQSPRGPADEHPFGGAFREALKAWAAAGCG